MCPSDTICPFHTKCPSDTKYLSASKIVLPEGRAYGAVGPKYASITKDVGEKVNCPKTLLKGSCVFYDFDEKYRKLHDFFNK